MDVSSMFSRCTLFQNKALLAVAWRWYWRHSWWWWWWPS